MPSRKRIDGCSIIIIKRERRASSQYLLRMVVSEGDRSSGTQQGHGLKTKEINCGNAASICCSSCSFFVNISAFSILTLHSLSSLCARSMQLCVVFMNCANLFTDANNKAIHKNNTIPKKKKIVKAASS